MGTFWVPFGMLVVYQFSKSMCLMLQPRPSNHQPSKPSCLQSQSKKSSFFSGAAPLCCHDAHSNGEMSSLCDCCCCFHYIFFFHAWIPSFTKNCHLVIYHLSKKMVALNSLIPRTRHQERGRIGNGLQSSKMSTFFPSQICISDTFKVSVFLAYFGQETKDSAIN